MQVSPASDQHDVYIASDSEVNNVIEFLSRSRDFPPEGGPSKTEDFEREPRVGDPRDYPYPPRSYEPFSSSDFSYHDRTWTRDGRDRDRPAADDDMSKSSSSGIGSEDPYARGGPMDNRRSRSSSSSPGPGGTSVDGKREGRYLYVCQSFSLWDMKYTYVCNNNTHLVFISTAKVLYPLIFLPFFRIKNGRWELRRP